MADYTLNYVSNYKERSLYVGFNIQLNCRFGSWMRKETRRSCEARWTLSGPACPTLSTQPSPGPTASHTSSEVSRANWRGQRFGSNKSNWRPQLSCYLALTFPSIIRCSFYITKKAGFSFPIVTNVELIIVFQSLQTNAFLTAQRLLL